MFIATVSTLAAVVLSLAAPPDEPAKTGGGEPVTNPRIADVVTFIGDVAMNRGTLELIGASATPIGIDVSPIDPPLKAQLNLDGGAIVARVVPDSEAAKAGVKIYDVVLGVDGRKVPDVVWLQKTLENPTLGRKVGDGDGSFYVTTMELVRETKPLKVELRRTAKPQVALTGEAFINFTGQNVTAQVAESEKAKAAGTPYRLGVSLAEADDVLRSQLKLADGQGLVVTQVLPDSPAAKAGVEKHDVFIAFDKSPTMGVADFTSKIQTNGDKRATLVLQRAGQKLNVEVHPKKDDLANGTAVVKEGVSTEVDRVVSDLIILTDKDGKRMAIAGHPAAEFVTRSPVTAEIAVGTAAKAKTEIESEIKALRETVDRLQAELARLDRERVVEKLQAAVARLEAAAAKDQGARSKK
jgi:C-terminal processing protease CtpA/Prc